MRILLGIVVLRLRVIDRLRGAQRLARYRYAVANISEISNWGFVSVHETKKKKILDHGSAKVWNTAICTRRWKQRIGSCGWGGGGGGVSNDELCMHSTSNESPPNTGLGGQCITTDNDYLVTDGATATPLGKSSTCMSTKLRRRNNIVQSTLSRPHVLHKIRAWQERNTGQNLVHGGLKRVRKSKHISAMIKGAACLQSSNSMGSRLGVQESMRDGSGAESRS